MWPQLPIIPARMVMCLNGLRPRRHPDEVKVWIKAKFYAHVALISTKAWPVWNAIIGQSTFLPTLAQNQKIYFSDFSNTFYKDRHSETLIWKVKWIFTDILWNLWRLNRVSLMNRRGRIFVNYIQYIICF